MHKYELIRFRSNYPLKPNDLNSEYVSDEVVWKGLDLDYLNKKRVLMESHY